jgi:hypothetical protein
MKVPLYRILTWNSQPLSCDIILTYNYETKHDNHDFKEVNQIIHSN